MEKAKERIQRIRREIEKAKKEINSFEDDFDKRYRKLSNKIDKELEAIKRECSIKF